MGVSNCDYQRHNYLLVLMAAAVVVVEGLGGSYQMPFYIHSMEQLPIAQSWQSENTSNCSHSKSVAVV